MRIGRRLASTGFVMATAAFGLAAGKPVLAPTPMAEGSVTWEGPQFVRADQDGKVYFLRGRKLEVYPLGKDGKLAPPVRLSLLAGTTDSVREAALDRSGERWLLLADGQAHLFVEGQEKELPALVDQPWSAGFVRDAPVIAVVPRPAVGRSGEIPWLVEADRDRWNSVVDLAAVYRGDPLERGRRSDVIAQAATFLFGDREGRLWTARQYAYRLEHYSRGGRRLLSLTVGGGKVSEREVAKPVEIDLRENADTPAVSNESAGGHEERKATFRPFTAMSVALDITEARDGKVYLLVRTESGGLAIDRYDPTAALLERRDLDLQVEGRMTIAAGREALYLAAWNGTSGRWQISWDRLDESKSWREVQQDGAP